MVRIQLRGGLAGATYMEVPAVPVGKNINRVWTATAFRDPETGEFVNRTYQSTYSPTPSDLLWRCVEDRLVDERRWAPAPALTYDDCDCSCHSCYGDCC